VVTQSESGMTIPQVQSLLKIKVQNTLLNLVNSHELQRKQINGKYVYFGLDGGRFIERHLALYLPKPSPEVTVRKSQIIEILLAIIHGNDSAQAVLKALGDQTKMNKDQVECIFKRYNLVGKC
jgi:hypothetical protein